MRPNLYLLLFPIVLFFSQLAYSGNSKIGFMAGIGIGSSSEEGSYSESPLGTQFFFDYAINTKSTIGVEHLRSWKITSFSTAIGFTNLSYKYFLGSGMPVLEGQMRTDSSYVHMKRLAYFLGVGVGFGQGSIKQSSDSLNASSVGLGLTLSGGLEYNYSKYIGIRSEFGMSNLLVGTGKLSLITLVTGIYFGF